MIDYFFKFVDETAAIAAVSGTIYYNPSRVVGTTTIPGSWATDRVTPGIQAWRASQDTIGTTTIGTAIVTTITHTPLVGWFGTLSTTTLLPSLANHSALQIAVNRELAAVGQTAILKCNITATLQDVRFSPVFAGSNYPFGNLR